MSLADYVRILGRGPGRSRALTQDEAYHAMQLMQSGRAAPEAVGALLMLLRMKGETASEIAGFARAAMDQIGTMPRADLDWPSYAAGRTRGLPWFLLAAKLVAARGHRVLLHGWNGPDAAVRQGLPAAGISVAADPQDAMRLLDRDHIAYLPLERLSFSLYDLLRLRDTLGLRSCINTVARMINPGQAPAGVQGVFHPSYRLLQADSARLLGSQSLSVIKGGGGEFERHPSKSVAGFGLRDGAPWQAAWPARLTEARRLDDGSRDPALLAQVWEGVRSDPFAEEIIQGTAELALDTIGVADPRDVVQDLWARRRRAIAV